MNQPKVMTNIQWNQLPLSDEKNFVCSPWQDGVRIDRYIGNEKEAAIPETLGGKKVRCIGKYAFVNEKAWQQVIKMEEENSPYKPIHDVLAVTTTGMEMLRLPDTLREIEKGAFWNCTNLQYIDLPDGLEKIGEFAFNHCEKLQEAKIPDSMTEISLGCFFECFGLTEVTLPETITRIGTYGFERCAKMENIRLPQSLEILDNEAFEDCTALKSVVIPEKVTVLPASCFWNCQGLESVQLPENLTDIHIHCFGDCKSLSELRLPKAFHGCCDGIDDTSALQTVYMPKEHYKELYPRLSFIKNLIQY